MRWKCVKQDASASELVSPFVQGNYRRQKPPWPLQRPTILQFDQHYTPGGSHACV